MSLADRTKLKPDPVQSAIRSHQNAKIVDDYATSVMSSLLTLNGVAIGAVLSAVASEKVFPSATANLFSAAAILSFGLGIGAVLTGVLLQRRSVAKWRDVWEERALGNEVPGGSPEADSAGTLAAVCLCAATFLFVLGAGIIAFALFKR